MITIGMNYQVLEGKGQIFEDAFARVLDAMQQMPGHSKSFLFKDVHRTGTYLIISDWSDKKAFDDFVKSEAFAKVTNWGKEQILKARPQHTVYTAST